MDRFWRTGAIALLLLGLVLPAAAAPGAAPAAGAAATAAPAGEAGAGWLWNVETVASAGSVGAYPALSMDPAGYPHITYYDGLPNYDLRHAWKDAAGWHFEVVDSGGNVGAYSALRWDGLNYGHVSYYAQIVGDLKYAAQWEPTGVAGHPDAPVWVSETVDSTGDVGQYSSLALGPAPSYRPYISYFDSTNGDLKYAYKDGAGWHLATPDSAGSVGYYTALALDTAGYPHVSYFDATNGDLKYAYQDAFGWHVQAVDAADRVGLYTSLALDAAGYPHVSYYDQTNRDLKYAYQDASGWHIETVDGGGDVGRYTSLALDGANRPHVTYCLYGVGTCTDLKYAYQDASGWHIETVDGAGTVGEGSSLVLDAAGVPYVAYYDSANVDLKYAAGCASALFTHDAPQCVNSAVAFTNQSLGRGALTYLWSFGDGMTSTVSSPTHVYAAPGLYTAILTSTASCGADVAAATIAISSTPDAGFTYTPTAEICAGEGMQFFNTSVGSATLSFIWDFGDGHSSYEISPAHAYDQAGIYQVTLLALNGCGFDTHQAYLTVHENPQDLQIAWAPDPPQVGHTVVFTGSAQSTLPFSYTWDFGDGSRGSGPVVSHVYTTTGIFSLTMTATNGCGPNAASELVTVVCYPVTGTAFAWTPPDPVRGDPVQFTATTSGTAPFLYTWAFGDGSTGSGQAVTHTYAVGGLYTVTLTATNFCSTQAVTQRVLVCEPASGTTFTWDPADPVSGQPVTFTGAVSGTAPITYTWAFGDGGAGAGEVVSHTYAVGGVFPVTLTAENPCGQEQVRQELFVCAPARILGMAWDPPTPTVGAAVTFTDVVQGIPSARCSWAFGDGVVTAGPCGTPVLHAYREAAEYTVTLSAQNDCGADALTGTLRVVASPAASFYDNAPVCLGETVVFTNTSSGAEPLSFRWDFGDGVTSTLANPTHLYAAAGVYTVTLTATNPYGSDTAEGTAQVVAGVSAASFAREPDFPYPGGVVTFTAQATGTEPLAYSWEFGDGVPGTGRVVTHTYAVTGTYTVTLRAANTCGERTAQGTVAVAYCTAPVGLSLLYPPLFAGRLATFTATVAAGSPPLTYAWDFGDGSPRVYGPPLVTHTYAAAGAYTLSLAVWNGCGVLGPVGFPAQVARPTYFIYLPLTFKGYYPGDAYEPDDAPAQANYLPLAAPQRHDFAPAEDVDWLYLDLAAGATYRFQTLDLAGGADTRLFLYRQGSYGAPVASNDDWAAGNCGGTPPDPKASCFVYTASAAGRYELKVDQYESGAVWGPAVRYTVEATQP